MSQRDLFALIIEGIQYDFREDDDEVQGTWEIRFSGGILDITYCPFDDSPYPAERQKFSVKRLPT